MKKRLFSIIIAVFMLCTAACSVYAESGMSIGGIVVKLAEYEKEDRAALISMSRSILGINSGVDMLKSTIRSYNGDTSDITHKVIGRLLNTYSKDQLISFLDTLKKIDEDTRYDFFTDIIKRNGNPVTDEQKDAINDMCSFYLGTAYPDFKRMCEEDGIGEDVIAKMLSVGRKINGDSPIYVDGADKNTLAYGELTDVYREFTSLNPNIDLDGTLAKINSNPNLVKAIMETGNVTGLYEGAGYTEDTNNSGESGNTNETGNDNNNNTNDNTGNDNTGDGSGNSGNSGGGNTGNSGSTGNTGKTGSTGKSGSTGSTGGISSTGNTDNTGNTDSRQSETFTDIANHWAKDYVNAMADNGIFKGYGDGTFLPDKALTRQEMAVTVVRVLGIEGELGKADINSFSDDDKIASWAKDYVYLLVSRSIFAGYADGSFGPDDLITREQFALVLSRISVPQATEDFVLSFADNDSISSWAKDAVREMAYLKIVTGYEDNTFRPANSLTRAEACTMIYRYLNK